MAKIVILGSGGWGIALGISANDSGNTVTLWTPFPDEAKMLNEQRESDRLKGIRIPKSIAVTTDINVASRADAIITAVPSFALRETMERLSEVQNIGLIINVAKGLDIKTKCRLSEVIEEYLPEAKVVVLSGPSHAEEVALREPTTLVAASKSEEAAEYVQKIMTSETLRVYTGDDVVGVELGGAFKNVIAVAAGICDGIGLGDNTKAAMMTRGLSEIARLGARLGAKQETFAGLTGIGDLIVTCTSLHSRNHNFGELVGKGVPVGEALERIGTVEGYHAAKLAHELAGMVGVELPITEAIYSALYEKHNIDDLIKYLMTRPSCAEHERSWLTKE